jgi:hypothetical protein
MLFMILVMYVSIAVLFFGYSFAFWQRNFPTVAKETMREDFWSSLILAPLWLAALPSLLYVGYKKGLKLYHGFKFNLREE